MFGNRGGNEEMTCCGLVKLVPREQEWEPPTKFPIPLISVDVNASVVHAVAQVQITQVYVNKEEQPIEAIYYFPVNPDGAVTHFQAELEGRVIKGSVKAHEDAKQDYENAVKNQTTAFLGEETKADIFKVRVGFLKPGTQVKITIGYVTEVKNEPGTNAIRFYIPTTIAPRYVSPKETDEKAQDIKAMQFAATSPAPLTLKVAVSLQGGIKSIESPTHTVKVNKPGPIPENKAWHKALVELTGHTTDMDRDFVLNIVPEEIHKPRLYSEKRADGSTAVMVHLVPSFKLDEQKTELIFVLDRSGSMMGQSIELAKKALLVFLHSMPADCYFNVIGFGSTFEFLFPNSVQYDDGSLTKAISHAKNIQANLGGTEILEPMKAIYNKPCVEGYLRQIFILTDGEVSNTDGVLGIAQANAHNTRVFALGIGDGASHYLVEGVAKAGGGTSAFVTYNESVDKKVLNQLKNGLQPSLTDIVLEWDGVHISKPVEQNPSVAVNKEKTLLGYNKPMEVDPVGESNTTDVNDNNQQSPKRIPPVYDGSQLLCFGLFKSESPKSVTVTAQSPDGPLSLKVEHSVENDVGSSDMLHHLAAVKLVRELELESAALHYQGLEDVSAREEKLKKQIVEIACQNGITSKYTSFVAIDTKDDKPASDNWVMETRHVPSQFAHGWHGGLGGGPPMMARMMAAPMPAMGSAPVAFCSAMPMAQPAAFSFGSSNSMPMAKSALFGASSKKCKRSAPQMFSDTSISGGGGGFQQSAQVDMAMEIEETQGDSESATPLLQLISLQSFDGSYGLIEKLCEILGKSIDKMKEAATAQNLSEKVFATAVAVAFFTNKLADEKDVWDLIVKKARKWLAKEVQAEKVDEVIRISSAFI